MTKPTTTTVIYRTGGWMNAKWNKTTPILNTDVDKIHERIREIERQGYKCYGICTDYLNGHGLPMGFCRHADSLTGHMDEKTCKCQ